MKRKKTSMEINCELLKLIQNRLCHLYNALQLKMTKRQTPSVTPGTKGIGKVVVSL